MELLRRTALDVIESARGHAASVASDAHGGDGAEGVSAVHSFAAKMAAAKDEETGARLDQARHVRRRASKIMIGRGLVVVLSLIHI